MRSDTHPIASADQALMFTAVSLGAAIYFLMWARRSQAEARQRIKEERHQRMDAEDLVEKRDEQLDQALAAIHELRQKLDAHEGADDE